MRIRHQDPRRPVPGRLRLRPDKNGYGGPPGRDDPSDREI